MSGRWIPSVWLDATPPNNLKRYALIELAVLAPAVRTTLFEIYAGKSDYWPLIDDDAQLHLKREGPWLLEVNDAHLSAWHNLEAIHCALHAWLESELEGAQLALQLAPGMVVENPEGARALLRFYLPEAIEQLYASAPEECRDGLFGSVQRWWYRNEEKEWAALDGLPRVDFPKPWSLKVNHELWISLHGEAEVMALTAELLETTPDIFGNVYDCERPRLVGQVLEKADFHGLTRRSDRRTYAYLQLSRGDSVWQEEGMHNLLQQAASGDVPLLELLEKSYGESSDAG